MSEWREPGDHLYPLENTAQSGGIFRWSIGEIAALHEAGCRCQRRTPGGGDEWGIEEAHDNAWRWSPDLPIPDYWDDIVDTLDPRPKELVPYVETQTAATS